MIRVFQDDGRCLAACVATITGADLDDVSPPGDECPWEQVSGFLADRGLGLRRWPVTSGRVAYQPDVDPIPPLAVAVARLRPAFCALQREPVFERVLAFLVERLVAAFRSATRPVGSLGRPALCRSLAAISEISSGA